MASSPGGLPVGYAARPASHDDLAAIDALYLASERELGVMPEARTPFLRWMWSQPYVDTDRDTRLVEAEGEVVGFAMAVHEASSSSVAWCIGRVHPLHTGRGVGSWMLSWYEDRGQAFPGARTLRLNFPEEDASGHTLALERGYRRVRTSYDMGVTLDGTESPGTPPTGVTIRPFVQGRDERTLWRVESEAFRDHWDHERDPSYEVWAGEWFGGPDGPVRTWVAEVDGVMVGGCGWVDPEAYVASVGVLRPHRGRGIATALLRAVMADAAAAGHRQISLSVDAENPTGALRVYEKAGMSVWRTDAVFDRTLA